VGPEGGGYPLAVLAARVGGEVAGDGERRIAGVRALADAGPEHLSLLTHPRYRRQVVASRAGAVMVPAGKRALHAAAAGRDLLVVDDPARALTVLLPLFHPQRRPAPGVHPSAIVGEGCSIDPTAHVGPYAVIGDGTTVGAGAAIEALAVVGRDCAIGAGARLRPHAVVYDGCEVGDGGELHSGAVIGADGFGFASRVAGGAVEHTKVPQVGRVVLEADVEVGVNSAIDRGALGETRVGAGSKIDNLVQVGHNCRLGRGVLLSGQVGLAGSTVLGDGVAMGGRSGSSGHLEIGAGTQVAGTSVVMQSVGEGQRLGGVPAVDLKAWRRQVAQLGRLDEVIRRLRAIERRVGIERGTDDEAAAGDGGETPGETK
jgi:UDP-3-O-[3-hydroxymyristoyl] glucosamine N-acyltransferase